MKNKSLLQLAVLATIIATVHPIPTTNAPPSSQPPSPSGDFTCLAGCKCTENSLLTRTLKIVDCQSPITFDNSTFNTFNLKSINAIYLKNLTIKSIEKNAFSKFVDLDVVTILHSTIDAIHPDVFDLPVLGTLTLINCKLNFDLNLSSSYLEELIISECDISKVPNLDRLPSLSSLNLQHNRIDHVDVSTFMNVPSLEDLTLSNNSIAELPADIFNNNSALNSLYLDNNPLTTFQLNTLSNLELLVLSSCKLKSFDRSSSKNLDIVSYLDLSNNEISILPLDAFTDMTELIFINLSNNYLTVINDGIFQENTKLQKIVLDGNSFEVLPRFNCLEKMFQTYFFSCNNCSIKKLDPMTFDSMSGLVILRLSNNYLDNIDGNVFYKIIGLKELDLSDNFITTITTDSFATNTALETINLSNNRLKPLDPILFAHTNMLKKLDVSSCNLNQLWINNINNNLTAAIPSLERLLLGNNDLNQITVDDLGIIPNLKLIDLDNNPLKCTQNLHNSILWLIKKSVYPIQGADKLKTHENLIRDDLSFDESFDQTLSWKNLAYEICDNTTLFDNDDEPIITSDTENNDEWDKINKETIQYKTDMLTSIKSKTDDNEDDDNYDEYEYNYDDDNDEEYKWTQEVEDNANDNNINNNDDADLENDITLDESLLTNRNMNLTRAFYVLSFTSVFVLTALIVLTVAVTVTLLFLRKNKSLNIEKGNLPRLKIPLWHATPGQKKHSGSIYRPLSEDLSGPKTPKMNRYEFKQNPIVHNDVN